VEISTVAETATLKGALRLGLDEVWSRLARFHLLT
jgi:hypothetical protein